MIREPANDTTSYNADVFEISLSYDDRNLPISIRLIQRQAISCHYNRTSGNFKQDPEGVMTSPCPLSFSPKLYYGNQGLFLNNILTSMCPIMIEDASTCNFHDVASICNTLQFNVTLDEDAEETLRGYYFSTNVVSDNHPVDSNNSKVFRYYRISWFSTMFTIVEDFFFWLIFNLYDLGPDNHWCKIAIRCNNQWRCTELKFDILLRRYPSRRPHFNIWETWGKRQYRTTSIKTNHITMSYVYLFQSTNVWGR